MKKISIMVACLFLSGCAHVWARALPHPDGDCPWDFPVKGNDSRNGFIYHTYDSPYYERALAEWCFTTEEEARAYGYRRFREPRSNKR